MFVRFRMTRHRLQASLVETRRAARQVRHEHVASLGTVDVGLSVADRLGFWQQLHSRLDRLTNRVNAENLQDVLAAIHARIPMVTQDELRDLKLDAARVLCLRPTRMLPDGQF